MSSSTILPGGPFYYHFEGKRDRPIIEFDQYGYFYNTSWSWQERENRQRVGPKDDVPIVCDFDDTTIAIGQPDRVNEVWIYEYTKTSNTWSSPTVLSNPGTTSSDFGSALSMNWDGNRLVVGSPGDNKFYVYDKDATTGSWSYYSNVITGSTTPGVEFGSSVSIAQESSDTICVGAPGSATGGTSVFVYEYDSINCTWSQTFSNNSTDVDVLVPYDATQTITMNNNLSRYGHSVSMSLNGEHFAVGAPGSQEITQIDQTNAATEPAGTITTVTNYPETFGSAGAGRDIAASQGFASWFGFSIGMSGDGTRIIGGSPFSTSSSGGGQRGLVEVYDHSNGSWTKKGSTMFGTTNDQYGWSVDLSRDGGTWIAGGRYMTDPSRGGVQFGGVKVYKWYMSTNDWVQVGQTLYGENVDDKFGSSVAISADGRRIAIGANYNDGGGSNSGHVRIYKSINASPTSYQYLTKLTPSDSQNYARFGRHPAVDGDTMVIGAHRHDDGSANSGAAYVFTRSMSGWTEVAKLTSPDSASSSQLGFGMSTSIDGDTIVIGAGGEDGGTSTIWNRGAAYVFTRNTPGDLTSGWTQRAKLTASDAAIGDFFGHEVKIDGDTIAVGAAWQDNGIASNIGAVYIFSRDTPGSLTSGWTQRAKLTPSDGAASDYFSYECISLDGDTIAIGSPYNDGGGSNRGAVYIFTRNTAGDLTSGWTQRTKLQYGNINDYFGFGVALEGDTLVIGAPDWDHHSTTDSGLVYIYKRDTAGSLTSSWSYVTQIRPNSYLTNNQWQIASYDWFGVDVAIDGDTMVVGAYGDDAGQGPGQAGAAWIWTRNTPGDRNSGWSYNAKLTAVDAAADDDFGRFVAISGETILISARDKSYESGAAYVWQSAKTWVQVGNDIDGEAASDYFGGDDWAGKQVCMSDDGRRVAIGALMNDGGGTDAGHVRVYEESNNSWSQLGGDIDGDLAYGYTGSCVAMDANGVRVAVGAYNANSGKGKVRVYQYDASKTVANANGPIGWDKIGQDITNTNSYQMSTVALNSDGTKLVVGHRDGGSDTNPVYWYEWNTNTNTWDLREQARPGYTINSNDWGASLAMSSDGNRFAVGVPQYGVGEIGVFTYTAAYSVTTTTNYPSRFIGTTSVASTSTWQNTLGSGGMYFYRQYNYLPPGGNYAGSMTNNTTYDPNGLPGFTRVFTRGTNSTWQGYGTQLGQVIRGNNVWTLSEQNATTLNQSWGWSRCGWKVALCKSDVTASYTDSLRLAVSSPGQPGINKTLSYSAQSGAVDTYRYDSGSGTWIHESTLHGDQQRDEYGHSISLDYTGNRLAISTKGQRESVHYLTPGYRLETSKVSVLEWNNDKWWEATPTIYLNGSTFPNSGESLSRTAYDSINVALTNGKHVFVTSPLYGNVFTQHVTLTQNFIGNSLFEGYVAANKYYVGANEAAGNSTNTKGNKIIEFGGFYGDAVYELTSIENRAYDSYESNESPAYLGRTEMLLSKLSQQRGIDAIRSVTQEYLVGTAPTTIGGSVIRRKALGTSGITNSRTANVHVSPTTTWDNLSDWYENFEFDKYDRDTSSFGVDSRGNVVINPDYRRPSIVWRGAAEYYPGYSWPYLTDYPDATAVDITQGQNGPDDGVDPGTFYGNAKLDVRGNALIRDRLTLGNDSSNLTSGWGREPAGLFINTTNSDNFDFAQQPWKIYLEDFYTSRDDSQTKLRTDYATIHGTMFNDSDGFVYAYDDTYNTNLGGQEPLDRSAYVDAILAQGSNNSGQKTGISFWIKIPRIARDSGSSNRYGIHRMSGTSRNGQWITGTAGIVWATERVLCTWGETTWGAAEYGGAVSNYPGFWIWVNWRDYLYSVSNTAPYGIAFNPYDHTGANLSHTAWAVDDNWHHVVFELPGGNGSNLNNAVVPSASNAAMYYDGSGPHPVGTTANSGEKIFWNHGTRVRLGAENYVLSELMLAQFRIYISWGVATQAPNARELYKEGSPTNRITCKGFGKFTKGIFVGEGILTRSGIQDPVTGLHQWQYIINRHDDGDTKVTGSYGFGIRFVTISSTGQRELTKLWPNGTLSLGYTGIGSTPHRLLINGSGGASGGFSTTSDDRIKYNETDITDPLALINQLNPQKYEKITKIPEKTGTWIPTDEEWENEKDNYTHSLEFGFIAQDVRKIPELAFLISGEETAITETEISPEEYEQLDLTDKEKCVPFYVRYDPNKEERKETKIKHEVYVTLNRESREKYTLKYTFPVNTQTPLSLNYTGLSVLTTAGLQKVDAQLQTTKTDLQNTNEDVRIVNEELQTKVNDTEFKLEKDKIAALETDLEREKLKTTNLQERILVMEHAYHALLERVSDLENQT
tara:strand:- start:9744 stop:16739 length:6996 start_codon:yes stop_codon:yes gene_type:complete